MTPRDEAPEQRWRRTVDRRNRPAKLKVDRLLRDFGYPELAPDVAEAIESRLAGVGLAITPSLCEVVASEVVTIYADDAADGQTPPIAAEPGAADPLPVAEPAETADVAQMVTYLKQQVLDARGEAERLRDELDRRIAARADTDVDARSIIAEQAAALEEQSRQIAELGAALTHTREALAETRDEIRRAVDELQALPEPPSPVVGDAAPTAYEEPADEFAFGGPATPDEDEPGVMAEVPASSLAPDPDPEPESDEAREDDREEPRSLRFEPVDDLDDLDERRASVTPPPVAEPDVPSTDVPSTDDLVELSSVPAGGGEPPAEPVLAGFDAQAGDGAPAAGVDAQAGDGAPAAGEPGEEALDEDLAAGFDDFLYDPDELYDPAAADNGSDEALPDGPWPDQTTTALPPPPPAPPSPWADDDLAPEPVVVERATLGKVLRGGLGRGRGRWQGSCSICGREPLENKRKDLQAAGWDLDDAVPACPQCRGIG